MISLLCARFRRAADFALHAIFLASFSRYILFPDGGSPRRHGISRYTMTRTLPRATLTLNGFRAILIFSSSRRRKKSFTSPPYYRYMHSHRARLITAVIRFASPPSRYFYCRARLILLACLLAAALRGREALFCSAFAKISECCVMQCPALP